MTLRSIFDLYQLRKQQWLDTEKLKKTQLKKLRFMVDHVYRNVRYYRSLLDSSGMKPEDIRTTEDLARIPITTRQRVQKLSEEDIVAMNVDLKACKNILTAGSSGMPLRVYLRQDDNDFYEMLWARTFLENGQRIFDRIVDFKYHIPRKHWFQYLGIWRKTVISILDNMEKKIERLEQIQPDVLRGNPFELSKLASYLQREGPREIEPRLIFSMGSLLDQRSRALLESVFRTEVFDCYGATEFGCIAWECSAHEGYHINVDAVILEIVRNEESVGPRERGRIVCTGLHSSAMPLIRYDLGDIGVLSDHECSCGRGLPLLESLEGRADDFLVSSTGILYSPSVIVNEIKSVAGISQFRIVQDSEVGVSVEIVPDRHFSPKTTEEAENTLKKIVGTDLEVEVRIVDEIISDKTGKIRSISSEVSKGFR